jgi:probable rRNA maturation factor
VNLRLETQIVVDTPGLPSEADFRTWAEAVLRGRREQAELLIRVVDTREMARLNQSYRKKSGPTNVLSFPFRAPEPVAGDLLGDLVICAPVVRQEAAAQGKLEMAHWAHMTVHGVLHLLGFDHQEAQDAEVMEELETEVLARLGFPPPY